MAYTELEKELIKLYEKLKDSPEKGFVERIPAYLPATDDDMVEESFIPSLEDWLDPEKATPPGQSLHKAPPYAQETNESAQDYLIRLYKEYGLGSWWGAVYTDDPSIPPPRWYQETKTHLSKNGNYYIVPVVYERMTSNPALQKFLKDGKIQLYGAGGVLEDTAFLESAKSWALEKLAADLAKALSLQNRTDAKKVAFLPIDTVIWEKGIKTGEVAEAWYVEHRPEEFQNLFLKVMFDRSWVDSLALKANPCADVSNIKHTVMLFVETLEKDLIDLQNILYRFAGRMHEATEVQVDFDASCTAGKISAVSGILDGLLRLNDKPEISVQSPGAIQIAFDEEYKIQYVAYSDVPDCLCDEENMSAYMLKKGVENLKSLPPFDSSTVNALLYYLPDIIRKYSPYLSGAKSKYLFAAQESWVRFIKSYVFPVPEVVFDTSSTSEELFLDQIAAFETLSNSVTSLLKKGAYTRDPTVLLSPEARNLLKGIANGQTAYAGDDTMMGAIKSQVFSIKTLYNGLLNRVPVTALVKIAASAIIKCTGDNAIKKKLCRTILKGMPREDVETKLIPCLQTAGYVAAANKLRTTIGSRQELVYNKARARYPDKFGDLPASQAIQSEAEMAKVNGLYCADPAFQKMLGRPADDFSEEMLLWLEQQGDDQVCECIFNIYTPIEQLFDFAEDLADDAADIVDIFGQNKAQQIETTTTYPIKNTFTALKMFVTNRTGNFGDAFFGTLVKIYLQILLGAVLVVLNHVKSEYIGGLLRDACNVTANPFSKKSITNMIMSSPLHSDKSFQQLKSTVGKMTKMAGLAGEIQDIVAALEKLGEQFTPSEFKRLFTTPCNDDSFNDGFLKASLTFLAHDVTQSGATDGGGTPTDAATSADGTAPPLCPAPPSRQPSIGSVQTLLLNIGSLVDHAMFEELQEEHDKVTDIIIDLCDPESTAILAVPTDALERLAEKDADDLTNDILEMMPLLDPSKIEDMMPPIFCGPCKPSQIGMQPMMPRQSHPSELLMIERANNDMYNMINTAFNNNLEGYKPIILDVGASQRELANTFRNSAPGKIGKSMDINLGIVSIPLGLFTHDREKALRDFSVATAALHDKSQGEVKLVAEGLIKVLESETSPINIVKEDEDFNVFEYDVPGSQILIIMMINYSDKQAAWKGYVADPKQIKIVAIDRLVNRAVYQWPDDSLVNVDKPEPIELSSTDLVEALTENLMATQPSLHFSAGYPAQKETFEKQFPIITNLVFENTLRGGTSHDLFQAPVFNKIPLTDAEVEETCIEGVGGIPLLNIEKISEDTDKTRQALECVMSAFAQPSSNQVATIFGLYKILMKVCIIEEYLKNIFAFGFLRVSDVTRSPSYMKLIQDSIINSVDALAGQDGYNKLLDYSGKIINGRQQLGDPSLSEKILTPAACLDILIQEAAEEVDDVLDARIQGIVDPNWTKKFYGFGEADSPEAQGAIMGRLLEYAVNSSPEYWSPDLYPFDDVDNDPQKLGNLKAMRFLGPNSDTAGEWPIASDGLGWPKKGSERWEGGLFFQPYMRVKSKITDMEDFWKKFIQAEKDTKLVWDSPISSGEYSGAKDEVDAAIDVLLTGIQDVLDNGDGSTHKETVKEFFDLVFRPEAQAPAHKLPFMRIVSSFWSPDSLTNPVWDGTDPYYYWTPPLPPPDPDDIGNPPIGISPFGDIPLPPEVPNKDNPDPNTGTPPKTEETPQPYTSAIKGSIPPLRWHWANRGVVSTHRVDRLSAYYDSESKKLQTQIATLEAQIAAAGETITELMPWGADLLAAKGKLANLIGQPISNHSSPEVIYEADLYESTLAMFGAVKELNFSSTAGSGYEGSTSGEVLSATESLLLKLKAGIEFSKASTGAGDTLVAGEHYDQFATAFWNRIRNIIFDSPASSWFDFKLGMRLNSLTPFKDVPDSFFSKIHTMYYDDFAKYNDEKTFIWEESGNKYFCFPIEQAEYDAYQFSAVINDYNSTLSMVDPATGTLQTELGPKSAIPEGSLQPEPSLWALARSIDKAHYVDGEGMLDGIKTELAKVTAFGKDKDPANPTPNKLLTNVVPLKELITTTALFYRYYMEAAYPDLITLLEPTKNMVTRIIAAYSAAAEGDYTYMDSLLEDATPGATSPSQSPTDAQLAKKFMLLFVQMAANMFDPTWTTPWFLPGPITPIGVVAKALLTDWSDDDDKDDDAGDITEPKEKVCPPKIPITAPEPSLVEEGIGLEALTDPLGGEVIDPVTTTNPTVRYLLVFPEKNWARYVADSAASNHAADWYGLFDVAGPGSWSFSLGMLANALSVGPEADPTSEIWFAEGSWSLWFATYGITGTYLKLMAPNEKEYQGVVVSPTRKLWHPDNNPPPAGAFDPCGVNPGFQFGEKARTIDGYLTGPEVPTIDTPKAFRDSVFDSIQCSPLGAWLGPKKYMHASGPALAVTLLEENPFPAPFVSRDFSDEGYKTMLETCSRDNPCDLEGTDLLELLGVKKIPPEEWIPESTEPG